MTPIRTLYYLAPLLLFSACGNRQPTQPVAQQYSQPPAQTQGVQQYSQPPAQAQNAQPVAQPYAQPAAEKPSPVRRAAGQPAPAPASYDARPSYQREGRDAPAPEPAAAPAPRQRAAIDIPAGTVFQVRLDETLDTKRNRAGDRFSATLRDPIVVDGDTVLARGTRCEGHLIEAKSSGRLKGRAELALSLDSFQVNGRSYDIRTTSVARESRGHKKRNWLLIGGGSGLGTALGAIAGGPAGALIGAGAGGAAGTAGAAFTGKRNVRLPAETVLAFRLRDSVTL